MDLLLKSRKLIVGAAAVLIGVLLPFALGADDYNLGQLEFILSIVLMACGLNIVMGFAGQLFIGPSALFAVGAYGAAILASRSESFQSLFMMCLVSVTVAVVLAAIVAIPTLRVGGFYFGMISLFIALAVPVVASNLEIAGGSIGISLETDLTFIQSPSGFPLYLVGIALVSGVAFFSWLILNSRLGRRFSAIRASDELARAVGVPVYRTKLAAFLLAAVPCGLGGAYYVYSQQFISPSSVSPALSIYVLAGVVIGGGGSILGPILGMGLLLLVNQFLGIFEGLQGVIFGVLLVLVALLLPQGIVGAMQGLSQRWIAARSRSRIPDRQSAEPVLLASCLTGAGGDGADRTLRVVGVRRAFGGVHAVDGVDLVVQPGTVHALVGTNGSGKTTLLNLICGYYSLDAGEIWLGDRRIDGLGVSAITRLGIARTFQTPKLSLGDTALHNVQLGADLHSGSSSTGSVLHLPRSRRRDAAARQRALDALAGVGLQSETWDPAGVLSHGTQRLLEIARAVSLGPRLILLDEPAAGLSVAEAEVLKEAVRALAGAGLGVLIVEHNLPVVFDVADHVTVLNQGVVICEGSPQHVARDPEVIRTYLGRSRPDPAAAKVFATEDADV